MIENLSDLKKLLKLCRQSGVTEIDWGKGSLKLGEAPRAIAGDIEEMEEGDDYGELLQAPITPEELVAFSNGAQ